MDFLAKLIQINEPITGEGKNGTWKRQEYIFETEGQYPRKICVSVWGDRGISDPSIMQIGNMLQVSFDLESREYNGRWYTDIRAWKIEQPREVAPNAMGAPAAPQATAVPPSFQPERVDNSIPQSTDVDDLPF